MEPHLKVSIQGKTLHLETCDSCTLFKKTVHTILICQTYFSIVTFMSCAINGRATFKNKKNIVVVSQKETE